MSYILEALKKAQAERQLGSAPTLHAVPVGAAPHDDVSGARRRPAWLMLAAAVFASLLVLALAVLVWRAQAPHAKPTAPLPLVSAPARLAAPAAMPAPSLAVMPPPVPALLPAATPIVARVPRPPAQAAAPVAPAPPTAASAEEKLPSLRDLPEAIQRAVPPLVFGGYVYSQNPADRLLLIDKSLRHEGEEVAPGLVLEKLLPNAALMNYKGNRYRVPY